ncbi:hypothetical protein M569_17489 [Genlisea aurea]|uniref:Uncharacterized protein n=1 Tax=Genlisea aurea TaxID=192259 RepID=S8BS03_9LAMI|nr:hypothetical protein M569_17489 [Genlisea aurea]
MASSSSSSSSSSSGHHHTCCNRQKVKRGLWSPEEDQKLIDYVSTYGHGCWSTIPRLAGLQRCGKSCRLRWINYLRPDVKRGNFTPQEAALIIELHRILGNRWSQIAKYLPGRTDNEVKNFWNSSIKKKLLAHARHCRSSDLYLPQTKPNSHQAFIPNPPPECIVNNDVNLLLPPPAPATWYDTPRVPGDRNQQREEEEKPPHAFTAAGFDYDLDKEILEALLPELDSEKSMSMCFEEEEEEEEAPPFWSLLREQQQDEEDERFFFPGPETNHHHHHHHHPYHIDNITALIASFTSSDPPPPPEMDSS